VTYTYKWRGKGGGGEDIIAGQEKDKELTSKPDYHFLIFPSLYLEKLSPLENLKVRGKIQDDVIQAYKCKVQIHQESEISQLSVPAIQNHSFMYNIHQYQDM
jgi:hypothetical protein